MHAATLRQGPGVASHRCKDNGPAGRTLLLTMELFGEESDEGRRDGGGCVTFRRFLGIAVWMCHSSASGPNSIRRPLVGICAWQRMYRSINNLRQLDESREFDYSTYTARCIAMSGEAAQGATSHGTVSNTLWETLQMKLIRLTIGWRPHVWAARALFCTSAAPRVVSPTGRLLPVAGSRPVTTPRRLAPCSIPIYC